jgi:5-methylcytosine-specific restriction endonuclease McrA
MGKGLGQNYAPGEAAFNKTLRSYRQNAQARGHAWELTKDDFRRLASVDCHYCGAPPGVVAKGSARGGDYVYNGLDRVDNALGYTPENVVTCCKICNHAKVDMSRDEFLAWIARLAKYYFFHPEAMPSRLLA